MPPRKRKAAAAAAKEKYEEEFSSLSYDELRGRLLEIGENPGPINDSNKDVYVRKLTRKKIKIDTESPSSDSGEEAKVYTPLAASAHSASSRSPVLVSLARGPLSHTASKPTKMATPTSSHVKPGPSLSASRPAASSLARKLPKPSLAFSSKSFSDSPQHIARFEVKGLVAAPFTPLTDSGELNLKMIKSYANHLCQIGVHGVFVNGTTGEGMSLTVEERKATAEEWVRVSQGRITVIIHVGTENLKTTCELASHAEEIGADAIGVVPPSFFKPATIEHLVLYMEQVAESAPNLPLFYYNIPSMSGTTFSMEEFLDVASTRLPTLRGIKFTSKDLFEFGRCVVHSAGRYLIIYGADEQLIGALSLGGVAAIGSTYNYAGRLSNRLIGAFQKGDMETARLEQRRSQAMIKLLFKYGGHVGVHKALMKLQGLDMGPPRLPLLPLSPEAIKSLEQDLSDIKFFEWA